MVRQQPQALAQRLNKGLATSCVQQGRDSIDSIEGKWGFPRAGGPHVYDRQETIGTIEGQLGTLAHRIKQNYSFPTKIPLLIRFGPCGSGHDFHERQSHRKRRGQI